MTTNGEIIVPNGIIHDLPNGESPTMALVQPTPEEQLLQTKKNSEPWRGALSLDAYIMRETVLADQEFTRDGGITFWALIDTAAKNRLMLSGCESFRKKALVSRNGKVQDVQCQGVGSVFCPPEYRRRGYAQRMMKELGEKLKTWQGENLFSILYSDIGKAFYDAYGWEPFSSSHISVPAAVSMRPAGVPEARPLYAEDLAELCTIDERITRESMIHTTSQPNMTFVTVMPDVATIRWHHAREEFVANEFHGRVPKVKGAIVGEPGKRVWCYWTRMWYNKDPMASEGNTLHILRLVIEEYGMFIWENPSPEQENDIKKYASSIASLLHLAQKEALEWRMAEVEIWNPTATTIEAARLLDPEAKVVDRESESIASLRWYGDRTGDGKVADDVHWVGNEKYGWC